MEKKRLKKFFKGVVESQLPDDDSMQRISNIVEAIKDV